LAGLAGGSDGKAAVAALRQHGDVPGIRSVPGSGPLPVSEDYLAEEPLAVCEDHLAGAFADAAGAFADAGAFAGARHLRRVDVLRAVLRLDAGHPSIADAYPGDAPGRSAAETPHPEKTVGTAAGFAAETAVGTAAGFAAYAHAAAAAPSAPSAWRGLLRHLAGAQRGGGQSFLDGTPPLLAG